MFTLKAINQDIKLVFNDFILTNLYRKILKNFLVSLINR